MSRHPFLDAFIPLIGASAADAIAAAIETHTALIVESVEAITSRSLPRTKFVILISGGSIRFYKQDPTSTAAEDGATVIWDSDDLPFVLVTGLSFRHVQVLTVATGNVDIATALNNGDSLNGQVLATGNVVLLPLQTIAAQTGIYVGGAAPARHADFGSYDDHANLLVGVLSGAADGNTLWWCSANVGGVLGTTDIKFTRIGFTAGGDVYGPSGATDGQIPAFDGSTGKLLKVSGLSVDGLNITLAQLAMQNADLAAQAQFLGPYGERFADSFKTLTYVNVAGATNLDTSEAGVLKPTLGNAFVTAADPALPSSTTGYGGLMIRFVLKAALFAGVAAGDQIRIIFKPPPAGQNNTIINHCFVGHAGASLPYFDGGQVRQTIGAANGVTLMAGGANVPGDAVAFNFDPTKDLIVAVELAATSHAAANPSAGANYDEWSKAGTGESGNTTVTGYSLAAGRIQVIDLVEVRAQTANNLTVASTTRPALSVPTKGRILAAVQQIDSLTVNTDLIFAQTRDGANFATAAMVPLSTTGGVTLYWSDADINLAALPSGTDMRWRLQSANFKKFKELAIFDYWR